MKTNDLPADLDPRFRAQIEGLQAMTAVLNASSAIYQDGGHAAATRIIAALTSQIAKTKRLINAKRRKVHEALTLAEKVLAKADLTTEEGRLHLQRLNIFRAEDAIRDALSSNCAEAFADLAEIYSDAASLLDAQIKAQSLMSA